MFKKDHIIIGLAIGFIVPAALYFATVTILRARGMFLDPSFQENTSLFMLALNGLLMRYFTVNRNQDNTGKGIVMATLILAIIWAVKYQM